MHRKRINIDEMKELYEKYSWLAPGESERENHETPDCSGSSKSLKVTMGENDGILRANCYRCGASGFFRYTSYPKINAAKKRNVDSDAKPVGIGTRIALPRQAVGDYSHFGIAARVWLGRAGITEEEVREYNILWNPVTKLLLIPIYSEGKLVGYQSRSFEDNVSRYKTYTDNVNKMLFRSKKIEGDTVVIVEDALSAIKVGRVLPSISLMGFKPSDGFMSAVKDYDKFFIWLDNDNKYVKLGQSELSTRLGIYGHTHVIHTDKDPKMHSEQEIRGLLCISS